MVHHRWFHEGPLTSKGSLQCAESSVLWKKVLWLMKIVLIQGNKDGHFKSLRVIHLKKSL